MEKTSIRIGGLSKEDYYPYQSEQASLSLLSGRIEQKGGGRANCSLFELGCHLLLSSNISALGSWAFRH